MKTPWLAELHRCWQAARGKRVTAASRAFSLDWEDLLDSIGAHSAESRATSLREAESLEKSGRIVLKRHRYRRYIIERVLLPAESEAWLLELFCGTRGEDLQAESLRVVAGFSQHRHCRFPVEWAGLCETLHMAFSEGRSIPPFRWSRPETLRRLLEITRQLSSRNWETGTWIRAASVEIGLDSKALELHQRIYESALSRMFGTRISLKAIGLISGTSHVELHGPVCLHFEDGSSHDFDGLHRVLISATDLERCVTISTTAEHLLSIENRKTTFPQYAAANVDRRMLIAASSFPTPAFREFLEKLPAALPHNHFGDTDPAGWHILLKLREATTRHVGVHQMKWRPASKPRPLTPYDRNLLEKLLAAPLLADVRSEIQRIADHQDRGDFEQETLGAPVMGGLKFEK
ncbi:hypothetical protein JIN84_11105 [Luteolibacter yonseiensis]|uniref:Wadjet protein JetD C-terminal domain-containing protein n=1 Tax=Luteolibacter yonseiensis TaxID=1144680 RepID=A0A934R3H8_9BACT|nr:Wadjet anti-phage system protein JetD domain-containing protein [Luteolibacter yonseiensis]MBK1816162.1 hypothetical protein [Luteolibacter yonseiensis]